MNREKHTCIGIIKTVSVRSGSGIRRNGSAFERVFYVDGFFLFCSDCISFCMIKCFRQRQMQRRLKGNESLLRALILATFTPVLMLICQHNIKGILRVWNLIFRTGNGGPTIYPKSKIHASGVAVYTYIYKPFDECCVNIKRGGKERRHALPLSTYLSTSKEMVMI